MTLGNLYSQHLEKMERLAHTYFQNPFLAVLNKSLVFMIIITNHILIIISLNYTEQSPKLHFVSPHLNDPPPNGCKDSLCVTFRTLA